MLRRGVTLSWLGDSAHGRAIRVSHCSLSAIGLPRTLRSENHSMEHIKDRLMSAAILH